MSQVSDVSVGSNPTGLDMRLELNNTMAALNSTSKGGSAPGSKEAGSLWTDDTLDPLWEIKMYDGADWVRFGVLNKTTNVFTQRMATSVVPASSGNATTINVALSEVFTYTTTEATTIAFSNPYSSGTYCKFKLFLTQDSTGRVITWPAAVVWQGGNAPTLSGASKKYVLQFETVDAGTTWFGSVLEPIIPVAVMAASSSAAASWDVSKSSVYTYTTTEATTVTFTNPPPTNLYYAWKLFLTQDGTGRTITWPASVKWSNGSVPVTNTASKKYVIAFETIDGGTTWVGTLCAEAYA